VRIAVVANGEWNQEWGQQELARYDCLIAADGGGDRILEAGFLPQALIGDLDSIKPENLECCRARGIQIQQFPREKDETDLELALDYAVSLLNTPLAGQEPAQNSSHLKEIWLLGATGGRVDHLLGNLALMLGFYKRGYRIRAKDPYHELWLIQGREAIKGEKGQELSLIPISEYAVISTEGLFYPLHKDTLRQDTTRGISNVFLGEDACVDISEGIVLAALLNLQNQR